MNTTKCAICGSYRPIDNPASMPVTEIRRDPSRDGLAMSKVYACDSCVAAGTDDDREEMGITPEEWDEIQGRMIKARVIQARMKAARAAAAHLECAEGGSVMSWTTATVTLPQFNINHYVRVRLTPRGRELLAEDARRVPKEDAAGWSEWQLHDLMFTFGRFCYPGCSNSFDPTIELLGDTFEATYQAAVALGRLGGKVKSEAKAAAARANGARKGRKPGAKDRQPRKSRTRTEEPS